MKLKLIYGRSGTGKSTYIYENIKKKLDLIFLLKENYLMLHKKIA